MTVRDLLWIALIALSSGAFRLSPIMTVSHTVHIADDEGLFVPVRTLSQPLNAHDKTIRSSPYGEEPHLLELDRLNAGHRSLALALQSFETKSPSKYAFIDYKVAFNIDAVVDRARIYAKKFGCSEFPEIDVYVIAFRSILHLEVQQSAEKRRKLATIDKGSHEEANASGGLLKYWFGTPDDVHAKNLATCWWRSKADAKAGGGGKTHREGMALVRGWFKHWQVEEYALHITNDKYLFSRIE